MKERPYIQTIKKTYAKSGQTETDQIIKVKMIGVKPCGKKKQVTITGIGIDENWAKSAFIAHLSNVIPAESEHSSMQLVFCEV